MARKFLAQPQSWRTTPCWPSTTAYTLYSQLLSVSGDYLLHPQPEDAPCYGDKGPTYKLLFPQEVEMAHFKENRDNLLKTYENMLKKEKEDTERCKREVQRYQQMFLKNTPTPNKSEYEVGVTILW
jgi:hypothetical protein